MFKSLYFYDFEIEHLGLRILSTFVCYPHWILSFLLGVIAYIA